MKGVACDQCVEVTLSEECLGAVCAHEAAAFVAVRDHAYELAECVGMNTFVSSCTALHTLGCRMQHWTGGEVVETASSVSCAYCQRPSWHNG